MFTPLGRIACAGLWLLLSVAFARVDSWALWFGVGISLLMLFNYFAYGTVSLAFQAYEARDWALVRKRLGQVFHRGLLTPESRAYFDVLSGVLALHEGRASDAREQLARAATGRMRTDNMHSKLECHRAEAALACGDTAAATGHLARAREIPHDQSVGARIEEVELRLATNRRAAG